MLTIRIYDYRVMKNTFTNNKNGKQSDEDMLTNRAYG